MIIIRYKSVSRTICLWWLVCVRERKKQIIKILISLNDFLSYTTQEVREMKYLRLWTAAAFAARCAKRYDVVLEFVAVNWEATELHCDEGTSWAPAAAALAAIWFAIWL